VSELRAFHFDVVVFDHQNVRDVADFEHSNQLSVGFESVLVNNAPVFEEGKMTNALPVKGLRGPVYAPIF
jgi:N-acyl-D-aspartate/D-glutamate deacylase